MVGDGRGVRYFEPEWEAMSRAKFRIRQFALLKGAVERAFRTNPFYRDRWRDAGVNLEDISSFEDFSRIVPMVDKETFLDDQVVHPPFGRRLGVDRSELAEIHVTSGTSGVGQAAFGLTANDVDIGARSYATLWTHAGLVPGDIGFLTYPVSFLTAGLLGVSAVRLFRLVPVYAFGMDKSLLFDLMSRLQPEMLFATPNWLRRLQAVATKQGWDPRNECPSLKSICMGLLFPPFSQVEQIMDFWGVRLYENYGTTEVGMAAAVSCEHGVWDGRRRYPMHFLEQYVYPEVVDPTTGMPVAEGEEGELVMTTLQREASPAIRFRTRDRVVHVPSSACSCGRPFDGIWPGEIRRYDEMLKVKGVSVWPSSVDDVVFARAEVDEYRAIAYFTEDEREELLLRVAFKSGTIGSVRSRRLHEIREEVRRTIMVTPKVEEVPALDHFEFKAKRWTDLRASNERP
jgi:phenylacetate-CoA ligase